MDRDKQDWYWFVIAGDTSVAFDIVRDCVAGKKPNLHAHDLLVRPDVMTAKMLEDHLWSLNDVENGRTRKVIHPSEFSTSNCDRKIAYGLLGEEEHERIDPKLRRIFDVGHVYHDVLQAAMGWVSEDFKSEVKSRHRELRISGSCDGVFTSINKGVELKSIGSNGYSKLNKAKAEHAKQATIYGVSLELDSIYYVYVCKKNSDLAVYETPIDRKTWHQMAVRATNIIQTVDANKLPPKLETDYECRTCKYGWTCKPEFSPPPKARMFSR